jgi:hypothetical protein
MGDGKKVEELMRKTVIFAMMKHGKEVRTYHPQTPISYQCSPFLTSLGAARNGVYINSTHTKIPEHMCLYVDTQSDATSRE